MTHKLTNLVETNLRPLIDVPQGIKVDGFRHLQFRKYIKGEVASNITVQMHFGESHEARVIVSFTEEQALSVGRQLIELAGGNDQTFASSHRAGDRVILEGKQWSLKVNPYGSGLRDAAGRITEEEVTVTLERKNDER